MRLRAGWSDRLADLSDYNLVGRVEDGGLQLPGGDVTPRSSNFTVAVIFFYRDWIYLIIMTYYSCLVNPGNVY